MYYLKVAMYDKKSFIFDIVLMEFKSKNLRNQIKYSGSWKENELAGFVVFSQ